jgi:hypothetical protein
MRIYPVYPHYTLWIAPFLHETCTQAQRVAGPGERSSIPNVDEDLLEELLAAGVKVKVK